MPLAARSRASRSTRNWSAWVDSRRSSSSSASKPSANTPPSRCSTGGCSTIAAASRCARCSSCSPSSRARARAGAANPAARAVARNVRQQSPGRRASVRQIARARAAQRDAGQDAFDVADARGSVRAAIASRALIPAASAPRGGVRAARAGRAAADAASAAAGVRPSGVTVESSTPSRVCCGCRRRCATSSSRCRRVAAFIAIALVAGLDRDRGQVRQALLLGFLDIAEQGAGSGDGTAAGPRCRNRSGRAGRRTAAAGGGRCRRRTTRARGGAGRCARARPAASHLRRRSALPPAPVAPVPLRSASSLATSLTRKRPPARSAQARPKPLLCRAASDRQQQACRGVRSSMASSVTVPGRDDAHDLAFDQALGQRRDRRSARRSRPIRPAPPVAPDSPRPHARGTPAIGIGWPPELPRWVRVMSSSRAALRASS